MTPAETIPELRACNRRCRDTGQALAAGLAMGVF